MSESETGTADPEVAGRFLAAYGQRDWHALAELMDDEVEWTLPGSARISGTAQGVDAIIDRVRAIVDSGVRTELHHIVTGQDDVALVLRNTAGNDDAPTLDEHLVTLLRLHGPKVWRIETYLSDVDGMTSFFGR